MYCTSLSSRTSHLCRILNAKMKIGSEFPSSFYVYIFLTYIQHKCATYYQPLLLYFCCLILTAVIGFKPTVNAQGQPMQLINYSVLTITILLTCKIIQGHNLTLTHVSNHFLVIIIIININLFFVYLFFIFNFIFIYFTFA